MHVSRPPRSFSVAAPAFRRPKEATAVGSRALRKRQRRGRGSGIQGRRARSAPRVHFLDGAAPQCWRRRGIPAAEAAQASVRGLQPGNQEPTKVTLPSAALPCPPTEQPSPPFFCSTGSSLKHLPVQKRPFVKYELKRLNAEWPKEVVKRQKKYNRKVNITATEKAEFRISVQASTSAPVLHQVNIVDLLSSGSDDITESKMVRMQQIRKIWNLMEQMIDCIGMIHSMQITLMI
ncbi:unnamed protein product [Miscanthus lutarioriparius]|uniref:Uncharacterized protein n=1 Tax=Miscanthus lutarioriparius TaxID=422564 RepID=A0A811SQ58_9POAL|nr:unnamed protein product [Miscanthus lutarioriparius]